MRYIFNINFLQIYLLLCFGVTILYAIVKTLISPISNQYVDYLKEKFLVNRYVLVAGYEIFEDDYDIETYDKEKQFFLRNDTISINDFKKSMFKYDDQYEITTFFWQTAVLYGFKSSESQYFKKTDSIMGISYLSVFGIIETCIVTLIKGLPLILLIFILNIFNVRIIPKKYFEKEGFLRIFDYNF
jgi:hypothetical protein